MRRTSVVFFLSLVGTGALADCGDKGGPGYRGPNGKCVGWAEIGRVCGNPPTPRCTAENTAAGAALAAEHGVKAWDAGNAARKAVGRTD